MPNQFICWKLYHLESVYWQPIEISSNETLFPTLSTTAIKNCQKLFNLIKMHTSTSVLWDGHTQTHTQQKHKAHHTHTHKMCFYFPNTHNYYYMDTSGPGWLAAGRVLVGATWLALKIPAANTVTDYNCMSSPIISAPSEGYWYVSMKRWHHVKKQFDWPLQYLTHHVTATSIVYCHLES